MRALYLSRNELFRLHRSGMGRGGFLSSLHAGRRENSNFNTTMASATTVVKPDPESVFPPFAKYAHGVVVPSGSSLLFTSGQLGIAPNGSIPDSAYEQAKLCFENIGHVFREAASSTPTPGEVEIVRINAFVTSREFLQDYMAARDEFMQGKLAASTLMVVSGFARPEFRVEVEAVASVGRQSRRSYHTAAMPGRRTSNYHHHHQQQNNNQNFHPPRRYLHKPRVEIEAVQAAVDELRKRNVTVIASWESEESRREVALKSRDYYWYSPILKPLLRGRTGDAVVVAVSEEDVVAACAVANQHKVPLVVRGAGTGNYGQAVPLRGGIILDMSRLDQIESFDDQQGVIRVSAGAKLQDIEDETRKLGWELRQHPSTRRQATIGGFVAGGSTGHGALMHGGLGEDGAILGLRVVVADDDEAKVLQLEGPDVYPVVHAYGTNGIITSVELPLARAQPWTDVTVVFDSLSKAAEFSLKVASAPAVVKRAVSAFQAPIASKFLDDDEFLHGKNVVYDNQELGTNGDLRHVSIVQCAMSSLGPVERIAEALGGQVTRTIASSDAPRPFYEFGWNHTTLHALKKDKSVTYMQAVLSPDEAIEKVKQIEAEFNDSELLQHLEVINLDGRMGFGSLALLWPQGNDKDDKNDRLLQILKWHEDNGITIFDPHTHILEDGGMKQTNYAQLGFKRRADPKGIMNPGKMRAWEEQAATDDTEGNEALTNLFRTGKSSNNATKITLENPKPSTSRYWSEWTTEDFATSDLSKTVAILPLGATEAHGPHLPLGVDSMHNEFLLQKALERLPEAVSVLALPPLEITLSGEHAGFAGTLEVPPETAAATWKHIGACVAKTGIRKLVLYNSHGGNQALAEVVARRLRLDHGMLCVLAMDLGQAGKEASELFPPHELTYGLHGGAIETSLMLHIRPDLVSMQKASDFASDAAGQARDAKFQYHGKGFGNKMGWLSQDLNTAGVVGDAASLSDAGKGSRFADASAANFADLLVELHDIENVDDILSSNPLFPPQGVKK